MSYTTDPISPRLARRGWRLTQSWWLLIPIFGFGMFSFIGFLYCAIRIRDRKWALLAGIATTAAIACYIVAIATTNENGESTSGWAGGLFVLVWFGSIGLAVAFNRDYLRKLAQKREASEARFHQPNNGAAPGRPPVAAQWPPAPPAFAPDANNPPPVTGPHSAIRGLADTERYYAPRPPAAPAPHTPDPRQQRRDPLPAAPAPAAAPIDINAAAASDIAESTGLDRALCEEIVAGRSRVGGFASLDDIGTATGLQPHHLARLRNVSYGPRTTSPKSPRTGGRVLDF